MPLAPASHIISSVFIKLHLLHPLLVTLLWSLTILMQNCNDSEIGKQFDVTWIVPVLEYCAPVWHGILTQRQSDRLEAVQRKALRIILRKNDLNYDNALETLGLKPL